MGIRVKNLTNIIIPLRVSKTLTATVNADCAIIPFDGRISNIFAKCTSGGTGKTHSILDVNLNGTSIFGASTKITLASTTGTPSYSALSSTPLNVTAGSILSLDVDQVSTNPINAMVNVVVTKSGVSANGNASDHNEVL